MLAMSDTSIDAFIPIFAATGTKVAFLVPTPTGYEKSIMDAIAPVRNLLSEAGIHNYETQEQGPANKVMVKSYFVHADSLEETEASLYRPVTKKGDPRIWFKNLKRYCNPCNLLSLITINQEIYVINLSKPELAASIRHNDMQIQLPSVANTVNLVMEPVPKYGGKEIKPKAIQTGFVFDLLKESVYSEEAIARELLLKIRQIHRIGFYASITAGDPGVGDTLEHALGIDRNNSKQPDYKGIELKATRLTRHGKARSETRKTLFTNVPDEGLTYHEILDTYGKMQIPRGMTEPRFQLYETVRASRPNAYGLLFGVEENSDKLNLLYREENKSKYVSAWYYATLKKRLLEKHHETFWVEATSETRDNWEFFRYDKVTHTKNPNVSLLPFLFEKDIMTLDLACHYKPDGKYKDHGMLFKMWEKDFNYIFTKPDVYDLTLEN